MKKVQISRGFLVLPITGLKMNLNTIYLIIFSNVPHRNIIITVIFASSSVCYFLLPLIINADAFTGGNLLEFRLYDISKSSETDLEMMAIEIENCSYPNLKAISVCENLLEALAGAHLVVICPSKSVIDDLHLEHQLQKIGMQIKHEASKTRNNLFYFLFTFN